MKKNLYIPSLRQTLTLLITALLAVLLLLDRGYEILLKQEAQLDKQAQINATKISNQIQQIINAKLARGDTLQDSAYLLPLFAVEPEIQNIVVIDAQKRIARATQKAWEGELAADYLPVEYQTVCQLVRETQRPDFIFDTDRQVIHAIAPLFLQSSHTQPELRPKQIGILYLVYDVAYAKKIAWAQTFALSTWLHRLPVLLLSGLLILLLLNYWIVIPIRRLHAATEQLAQGDYSADPRLHGNGELARLAECFNYMSRELRQAHQRLEQERQRAQHYLDVAGVMLIGLDTKGDITLINRKGCALLGLPEADILGKNWFADFLLEAQKNTVQKVFAQLMAGNIEKFEYYENMIIDAHGEQRIMAWHNSLLHDAAGKIIGLLASGEDITERVETEAALHASEVRWKFALEGSGDGIWDWDAQSNKVFYSRQWKAMLGYAEDEIGDTLTDWQKRVHPDDLPICVAGLKRHVSGESSVYQNEHRILCADGNYKWILDRGKVIEWDIKGKPVRIIGTHTDISQRKAAELALQGAKEEAEAANHAKSAFLASMSHELRTPLNVILGFTQIMEQDSALNDAQRQHLASIHRSGDYLLTLINDVLDLAKIEAGHLELLDDTWNPYEFFDHMQDMFCFRAKHKGLDFHCHVPKDLPKQLRSDEKRLRQILINLLSNALKFTEQGSVSLSVTLQSDHLQLSVSDTGIGIAAKDLKKIFEPFRQSGDKWHKSQGTGLGLSITQRLIKLMGGDIKVVSTLDEGSEFTVYLPVEVVSQDADTDESTYQSADSACLTSYQRTQGKGAFQVLVVDDEQDNRAMLKSMLKALGFSVTLAENGQQGLDYMQNQHPDLVLMDLQMPEMDGMEMLREVQKRRNLQDLPIVAVSAHAFNADASAALRMGAQAFLSKPLIIKELKAVLADLL